MSDARSPLEAGADLSKVYGDSARCPACGAFAQTNPHPDWRWVCAVCGAPRVVMPGKEAVPAETAVALREAANAQRAAAMQRLTSWGTGAPAAITLLLAIVLAPASYLAAGLLVATGVVLALLALRAARRAATERKRLRSAVDRAYEAAITTLAAKEKPADIAAGLRIAEGDVEAALAVEGLAQVRVDDARARISPEAEFDAALAEAEAEQRRTNEAKTK